MRRTSKVLWSTACSGVLAAGLLSVAAPVASAAPPGIRGDFNGDGYGDVAAASDVKGGRVTVFYGSASGRFGGGRVDLGQHSPGVPGTDEDGDRFGKALSVGDFDKDGYSDLAVGVPGEVTTGQFVSGAVTVLWGGAFGLSGGTAVDTGAPVPIDPSEGVGTSVAAADFTGDGQSDLAVAAGGTVRLVKGPIARSGRHAGVVAQRSGGWIHRLLAADMDGDSRADLTVVNGWNPEGGGIPSYSVVRMPGTPAGIGPAVTDAEASEAVAEIDSTVESAIGDIDGDGRGDLAFSEGWRVTVVHSGGGRRTVTVDQDTEGVPGTSENGDNFGDALAIGDVDGDGFADLAVGAPGETLGSGTAAVRGAGAVTLLRGSAAGVTTAGAQFFTQDSAGVPGHAEKDDRFGSELLLSDADGDGRADLTVTAERENGTGMIWNLPGTASGLTGEGSAYFGAPAGATGFGSPLAG